MSAADAVQAFARRMHFALVAMTGHPHTAQELAVTQAAVDSLAAEYRSMHALLFERLSVVLQAMEHGVVQVAIEPEAVEAAVELALRLDDATQRRTAWLCERGEPSEYLTVEHPGRFGWTLDPGRALRLASQADAEALAAVVPDCWRVSEHVWGVR